ncbi:heparan-alpha-glucosaminide N-acetyltransferase domain-containing protein [Nesterenkonia haasae]|uniref:heparan-alpha-glucosaminide N-acetyltransferase domain-containing protein n=1 Tax=Nesterenkonia haasae TaxID=2587813 RepID=UPI001391BDA9|nr:heparan-alpha-glucosaminide N-acetyltransferase domain-containing protein [Nesterenkonia haasae]NDK33068.1 DUF1624 domain-containing protein [Nesterenkonia haasae]
MTSPASASRSSSARGERLWGVDAARGLALLGMVTVHVLPTTDPGTGDATWAGMLFSGRSAALFAVLAGVGLALLTGGAGKAGAAPEHSNAQAAWYRKVIAARAAVIIGFGLFVSLLGASVAVILVHYGVLFLLALPFLRMGAKALMLWAAGWVAASPVLYWWLQNLLRPSAAEPPERLWHSPMIFDLAQPGLLGLDLFVTGYYPLILWPAYLFTGMALGRLSLGRTTTQWRLLLGGTAGAVLTYGVGWVVEAQSQVVERMRPYAGSDEALQGSLETGDHFLPLVTDPMWFLLPMPHQGSHMDLLHTISCAVAVLGLMLILVRWLKWPLAPLVGAGAMPLSLYVGHLIVLGPFWRLDGAPFAEVEDAVLLLWLVVAALAAGMLKVLLRRRGPLEALTHGAGIAAAGKRPR